MKILGIYKITSPNKKIYIGQSTDIEKRLNTYKGLHCKTQVKLYNSFNKYGFDTHIFEIIEECAENKLLERETHWKLFYKVLEIPSLCCKLDGRGGKMSEEIKQKISKANKGRPKPKGFGDKLKNHIRREQINKCIGKNNTKSKPKGFGDKISKVLTGKSKSEEHKINIGIFHKNRIRTNKENINRGLSLRINILQYDLNGNFIKEWNGLIEVQMCLGINKANVWNNLNKLSKSAGGFIWKYKN